MILNNQQIEELIDVIKSSHIAFVAQTVGKDVLTRNDLLLLQQNGIDINSIPEDNLVHDAFYFGILSMALGDERASKMTYEEFLSFIRSKNYVPLTKVENVAYNHVKNRFYNDLKGLGNRIASDLQTVLIEYDAQKRTEYENIVRDKTAEAIQNRDSMNKLARTIGKTVEDLIQNDWTRDFDRMANYLLHEAYDTGRSSFITENFGHNAQVYKIVHEGACDNCKRLYLTDSSDIFSKPLIFPISELINNGSNIGVKTKDWKPVIGPTHPFCRCTLMHLQENSVWNENKNTFEIQRTVKTEYSDKIKNRSSRVKITKK